MSITQGGKSARSLVLFTRHEVARWHLRRDDGLRSLASHEFLSPATTALIRALNPSRSRPIRFVGGLTPLDLMNLVVVTVAFGNDSVLYRGAGDDLLAIADEHRHPTKKFPFWTLSKVEKRQVKIILDDRAACRIVEKAIGTRGRDLLMRGKRVDLIELSNPESFDDEYGNEFRDWLIST